MQLELASLHDQLCQEMSDPTVEPLQLAACA